MAAAYSVGTEHRSKVFLGADNHPIQFDDMMKSTIKSGKFQGEVTFTGQVGGEKVPAALSDLLFLA